MMMMFVEEDLCHAVRRGESYNQDVNDFKCTDGRQRKGNKHHEHDDDDDGARSRQQKVWETIGYCRKRLRMLMQNFSLWLELN